MNQIELDRAVAKATGETRRTIGRLGFSLVDPWSGPPDHELADIAKFLDWDQVAAERHVQRAGY